MSPGPVALVGSGEYLPVMQDVDRQLLSAVGGASARVVVLPTASGLEEPSSPRRWVQMGIRHFTGLGAQTDAVNILSREDAFDERWLPLLERADLIYFSGGSPRHLVDAISGSPAWEAIRARHAAGAVLAGCSAGAMAFGRVTLSPRRLWGASGLPADTWYPALGLVPNLVVLPHFDRWLRRMPEPLLQELAASLPADVRLIGIDEDTALVSFDGQVWQVQGRQSVSIIDAARGLQRYEVGAHGEYAAAAS
jgi:cyanophycinase